MSNLTRFDPLSTDPVSELFQGFFRPMRSMLTTQDNELGSMKIDVTETDSGYSVKAELPGVEKKDIDVQIDGRVVSISAKVERNKEEKEGERVIRRERYSGTVHRSFALGGEVDEATAKADYKDGVLSLSLPKKASGDRRRLTIEWYRYKGALDVARLKQYWLKNQSSVACKDALESLAELAAK